ncbi:hypothetical protein R1X32_02195 (plasmid) [Rhodococcus opacus]|uniref:Uncharacterized protein n=1 Tax=Rhodococcus opacus TaxID=37919 RepID=A0ABT4NRS4_RHOOP|nr:hypothetical protein [Rhodococcus opacus]MCZ4590092.1 hypothetical protein [Rhodococcus opacus]WKN61167.1 hypothetical protein HJ581_0047055 [Rhodococcus opacus]
MRAENVCQIPDREASEIYLSRVMPLEYETLFAVAGRNLELGHSVVLDAPFVAYLSDPDYLLTATARAGWPETRIQVIQVTASAAVVKQRLVDRGLDRDRVKLDDWDSYWRRFGALECRWQSGQHHFVVNDDAQALRAVEKLITATGHITTPDEPGSDQPA